MQTSSENIIGELRKLEKEIKAIKSLSDNLEEYDMEALQKQIEYMSDKIHDNWQEMNKRWTIIVLHNEIDMIGVSLVAMRL